MNASLCIYVHHPTPHPLPPQSSFPSKKIARKRTTSKSNIAHTERNYVQHIAIWLTKIAKYYTTDWISKCREETCLIVTLFALLLWT